jgi:hypothetical protein
MKDDQRLCQRQGDHAQSDMHSDVGYEEVLIVEIFRETLSGEEDTRLTYLFTSFENVKPPTQSRFSRFWWFIVFEHGACSICRLHGIGFGG